MTYEIQVDGHTHCWTETALKESLEAIGSLQGKKTAWIRQDLSICRSNWLTRLFWTVVAKHFCWMRKKLYGVDLERERKILCQLHPQISKNPGLMKSYTAALKVFNEIAPSHFCHPPAKEAAASLFKEGSLGEDGLLSVLSQKYSITNAQGLQQLGEVKREIIDKMNNQRLPFHSLGLSYDQFVELLRTEGSRLIYFECRSIIWNNELLKPPTSNDQVDNIIRILKLCPNLSSLKLNLSSFPKKLIDEISTFEGLQELKLSSSKFSNTKYDLNKIYHHCRHLCLLDLENFDLSDFPSELGILKRLTVLRLKYAKLSKVPERVIGKVLLKMPDLRELDFQWSHLRELPVEIAQLEHLESLNLTAGEFHKLPSIIGKLKHLRHLDLTLCRPKQHYGEQISYPVEEFDRTLEKLTNLEALSLAATRLKAVPESVENLAKLQSLNLSENHLHTLPPTLFNKLVNLRNLNLRACPLKDLPQELGTLKNLQKLNLLGVKFNKPPAVLKRLKNCKITLDFISKKKEKAFHMDQERSIEYSPGSTDCDERKRYSDFRVHSIGFIDNY